MLLHKIRPNQDAGSSDSWSRHKPAITSLQGQDFYSLLFTEQCLHEPDDQPTPVNNFSVFAPEWSASGLNIWRMASEPFRLKILAHRTTIETDKCFPLAMVAVRTSCICRSLQEKPDYHQIIFLAGPHRRAPWTWTHFNLMGYRIAAMWSVTSYLPTTTYYTKEIYSRNIGIITLCTVWWRKS